MSKNDATNSFDLLMWEKLFDYSILDNSVIGYITPKDKLDSREQEIFAARDRKLTYKDKADIEREVTVLQKAGLPEKST